MEGGKRAGRGEIALWRVRCRHGAPMEAEATLVTAAHSAAAAAVPHGSASCEALATAAVAARPRSGGAEGGGGGEEEEAEAEKERLLRQLQTLEEEQEAQEQLQRLRTTPRKALVSRHADAPRGAGRDSPRHPSMPTTASRERLALFAPGERVPRRSSYEDCPGQV